MRRFYDGDRVQIQNPTEQHGSDFEFPQGTVEDRLPDSGEYVVRLDEAISAKLDGKHDITLRRVVVREELLSEPTEWVGVVGLNDRVALNHVKSVLGRLEVPFRVEDDVRVFKYMVFVPKDHHPDSPRTLRRYKRD